MEKIKSGPYFVTFSLFRPQTLISAKEDLKIKEKDFSTLVSEYSYQFKNFGC
jgi:hypothetical protein